MKHRALAFLLAAVAITGCAGNPSPSGDPKPPIDIHVVEQAAVFVVQSICPGADDPLRIVRECVTTPFLQMGKAPTAKEIKTCILRAAGCIVAPPPTPTTSTPVPPSPSAPPASTPTSIPTVAPSPTSARWTTRLVAVNGFGGANPYPCDPRTPACAAVKRGDGAQAYPIRNTAKGDRTGLYDMPGYDVIPKGTGCDSRPRPDECRAKDSPGMPCAGSAACDGDHLTCPRTNYGCNGVEHESRDGWCLSVTPTFPGSVSCDNGDGFGFSCSGVPGSEYEICAFVCGPVIDVATGKPMAVKGDAKACKKGFF